MKKGVLLSPTTEAGFMAYQIHGEGKWRYSEFKVIFSQHENQRKVVMTSFTGNGYGHFYLSSLIANSYYQVFVSLKDAQLYADSMNHVARGRMEDEMLIASGGRYIPNY